jgi:endo-1,4-beta-xylanase
MIICPGGGHSNLNTGGEGHTVAKWMTDNGIAAFVLKYRLAREKGSPYKIEVHALQDGQRAIRLVRANAQEWNVDPQRVGIMGFSAGGEVVAYASTRFDKGKEDASDPVERQSCRPDFQVLIYSGPLGIKGATLTKDVPPAFIAIGEQDNQATTMANHFVALKKHDGQSLRGTEKSRRIRRIAYVCRHRARLWTGRSAKLEKQRARMARQPKTMDERFGFSEQALIPA